MISSVEKVTQQARQIQEHYDEVKEDGDLDAYGAEAQQKRRRVVERETCGYDNGGGNKTLSQSENREVICQNQTMKGEVNKRRGTKTGKSTSDKQQAENQGGYAKQ